MGLLMNELKEFVQPEERDPYEERRRLYGCKSEKGGYEPMGVERACETCGSLYMPKTRQQRYCSRACSLEGRAAERMAAREASPKRRGRMWDGVTWRQLPTGESVAVEERHVPHMVEVGMERSSTRRYTFDAEEGDRVLRLAVDGVEYVPSRKADWDDMED